MSDGEHDSTIAELCAIVQSELSTRYPDAIFDRCEHFIEPTFAGDVLTVEGFAQQGDTYCVCSVRKQLNLKSYAVFSQHVFGGVPADLIAAEHLVASLSTAVSLQPDNADLTRILNQAISDRDNLNRAYWYGEVTP